MKKGFYCDKDGEILLITENESNNFEVKSNNSQCSDCVHNEICQFYNALGAKVICYPCGFYEAKSNEELFKQALVEGVNRHIDKTIEKEKQIADIARDFNKGMCSDRESVESCEECVGASEWCLLYEIATKLYNAGYRKQNEWISVEDRLPEENGRYLVCANVSHLAFTSLTIVVVMEYGKNHGFYLYSEDEPVTHWMPLPEAPKMKGGEE